MHESDRELILSYLFDISNKLDSSGYVKNVDKSLVHKEKSKNVLIHDICNVDIEENRSKEKFSLYYSIACPNFDCDFIFDHPLDHYSFILMMEIGRQMSIGVTH